MCQEAAVQQELSRISQFSYVCESYLKIDLALCQRLISSSWSREPCRVCMLLGVLADVCEEVCLVLGVIVPVLVTCLIAVSKYLVNKGKEVFYCGLQFLEL